MASLDSCQMASTSGKQMRELLIEEREETSMHVFIGLFLQDSLARFHPIPHSRRTRRICILLQTGASLLYHNRHALIVNSALYSFLLILLVH